MTFKFPPKRASKGCLSLCRDLLEGDSWERDSGDRATPSPLCGELLQRKQQEDRNLSHENLKLFFHACDSVLRRLTWNNFMFQVSLDHTVSS